MPEQPYACTHGSSAPETLVKGLGSSQAGVARHRCAVCAYARGEADGRLSGIQPKASVDRCQHGSSAPRDSMAALPQSQAGPARERHKCCICAYSNGFAAGSMSIQFPDDVSNKDDFEEGAVRTVMVNAFERNALARQRCIEHYGLACSVCALEFGARYGPFGQGLIHVHHLKPLAVIGHSYKVDPIADLRPVCPNCHAVIHRSDPPLSIETLRAALKETGKVVP